MHIGIGGLLLLGLLAVILFGSRAVLIRLAWVVGSILIGGVVLIALIAGR